MNAARRLSRPLTTLAALVLAAGCAGAPAEPAYRPDLNGAWRLDPAESNDSSALALAFADSTDPRVTTRRPGGFPTVDRASADTPYLRADPVRTARLALALVRQPAPLLTIAATDSLVRIRAADAEVAFRPDWVSADLAWPDGEVWLVRSRWREGRLEVERRLPEGPRLREYYSRSPGGNRLVVFTLIEIMDEELSVRRVYRLAEPGDG